MTPLHVLVFAPFTNGACNVYRFGILARALAAHGVELRSFGTMHLAVPSHLAGSPDEAFASEDTVLDRTQLDWADVIVFRRFYTTRWTCLDCAFVGDRAEAQAHRVSVGHELSEPDRLIRPLYNALEQYPSLLRGRAIVYETDDDLFDIQPWNGTRNRVQAELDIVERMLRRADLVTVSTPVLRSRLGRFNDQVRVLRNAVDPSWYQTPADAAEVTGSPRLLYYGSPARMRDYEVCRPAVDQLVRELPEARRVWLGAHNARAGGSPAKVLAAVDETGPFLDDPQAFAAALTAARPDIGLAPLVGDAFDQAKSELHWLEYSMAGAATVATRPPRAGGPYSAIRDGVDGLLAGNRQEWLSALRRLAGSAALREDLAAGARERVLAEYSVDVRAQEWADAYRWAAEHAGRRVGGRVHGLGSLDPLAAEAQAAQSLAHRAARRELARAAPVRLDTARAGRPSCGSGAVAAQTLVSVVVPVVDEPPQAVLRAVRSALSGTHGAVEVVLSVASGWPHALAPVTAALGDVRVRALAVDDGDDVPPAPDAARAFRLGRLVARGVAAARADWIAPLAPDAAFRPDHVDVLLGIALEHELEFVYGQAEVLAGSGPAVVLGTWPPNADEVLTLATELFAATLASVAPLDAEAWRDGETSGWAFWRTLLEAGVRMAGIEHVVTTLSAIDSGDAGDDAAPAPARLCTPGAGTRTGGHADAQASGVRAAAARSGRDGAQGRRGGPRRAR